MATVIAPLLSASWYRVAKQRPQLREHVAVRVHRYRKQIWYVLHDPSGGASLRLDRHAYAYLSLLDGQRTLDQAWRQLVAQTGEASPSQDEIIGLLGRLHQAEMFMSNHPPDVHEMIDRRKTARKQKLWSRLLNPMSISLPLWDPDHLLTALLPLGRLVFGWIGAIVWLAVVARGLVLAGQNWAELTNIGPDRLIGLQNLAALSVSFFAIKLLHEMGHGLALKAFGGEVHELGVMLIVLFPSPYVNASAANAFPNKWRRALVGAAGMIVELFVAALAIQVWALLEPGLVRTLCYNVVIVASVSTLVFNGNPLMRYDGYYILCDLIEIPNLAQRGSAWWGHRFDRIVLSLNDRYPVAQGRWEKFWLSVYPPVSLAYRLFVMAKMAFYVAGQYLIVGMLMAVWSLFNGLVLPVIRGIAAAWRKTRANRKQARSRARFLAFCLAVVLVVCVLPMPHSGFAEGVTWLPEAAIVRAGTDGFIDTQMVPAGAPVQPGQVVFRSSDPDLSTKVDGLQARVDALAVQSRTDFLDNQVKENLTRIEMMEAGAELTREQARLRDLASISHMRGPLTISRADDQMGDFHKQGDILAFIAPTSSRIIRVTVGQDDVGLVRAVVRSIRVILAPDLSHSYPARLVREVPEGTDQLPSRALGDQGGGSTVTVPDAADTGGQRAIARMFQFDLALPSDAPARLIGVHAYVRFNYQWEPICMQLFRRVRQAFMTSLNA